MRRVFVRGVGAVTPLAATWPESVARLARGETAIGPVRGFDVDGFPSQVAAAIETIPRDATRGGGRTPSASPMEGGRGGPPGIDSEDRRLPLARAAMREARRAAGPLAGTIGVFLGAESGRASFATVIGLSRAAGGAAKFDHARFGEHARGFAARIDASVLSPSAVASALAAEVGAGGPVETVCLACASGSAAIVEAVRAIRAGECDVAVCGGVGADVDPLMLAGFGLLGALSGRGRSCPFDTARDGFVVGEGAAMLILAAERGDATVEIAGVGRSLDGYHLTAPEPEGDGAARAMAAALADAGEAEVDCVQAHGTSTPLNDAVEIMALARVLGAGFARAWVSSVKGAVGHWVAGAGAVGVLCAHEAVARGVIVPTAGLREPDPACAARHVIGEAVRADVRVALANAFAFGGANSSVVLRRCPEAA